MQNFLWQYAFCQISAIFQKNRVQVDFAIASWKTLQTLAGRLIGKFDYVKIPIWSANGAQVCIITTEGQEGAVST